MTNRKEYTFLEAMELLKAGEIVESCRGDKYKSCNGKLVYDEVGERDVCLVIEELKSPWFKVEKKKPKKWIEIYEHEFYDHDQNSYNKTYCLRNWITFQEFNYPSNRWDDLEHISTKLLKTIKVEDRGGVRDANKYR